MRLSVKKDNEVLQIKRLQEAYGLAYGVEYQHQYKSMSDNTVTFQINFAIDEEEDFNCGTTYKLVQIKRVSRDEVEVTLTFEQVNEEVKYRKNIEFWFWKGKSPSKGEKITLWFDIDFLEKKESDQSHLLIFSLLGIAGLIVMLVLGASWYYSAHYVKQHDIYVNAYGLTQPQITQLEKVLKKNYANYPYEIIPVPVSKGEEQKFMLKLKERFSDKEAINLLERFKIDKDLYYTVKDPESDNPNFYVQPIEERREGKRWVLMLIIGLAVNLLLLGIYLTVKFYRNRRENV